MTKSDKYAIYKFVKFVKDELGITVPFKIRTSEDRSGFKTFAYYNPNDQVIAVYIKNRSLPDVMRSIAHELVHHYDHQTGLAQKQQNPDVGVYNNDAEKSIEANDIENRANAIAGSLIKKFGYANSDLNIWGDVAN
jgi:Zn-dependent peptidase ImmA (M78 family)